MELLQTRLAKPYQALKDSPYWPTITVLLISVVSLFMSIRLLRFVSQYAVNLIFYDEFGFMSPIFDHQDLWTVFRWQHGPHRQGLGGVISKFLMDWSGINIRVEAFAIAVVICLALVLVLLLKRLLFGRFHWMDVLFPVAVLTLYQFEIFIVTPNLAHSATPLFLVFFYSVSWLIKNRYIRYAALLFSNFLLLFTGFGIFMGIITVLILSIEVYSAFRGKQKSQGMLSLSALILSLASIAVFLQDYTFYPAVDCFGFSPRFTIRYPAYIALIFSKFFGIQFRENVVISIGIGLLITLAMAATMLKHGWNFLHNPFGRDQTSKIIFILTGFSLIYTTFTAVGRVCLGMDSAQSSRYMSLIIPGFVGMLFSLYTIQRPSLSLALFCLAFLLLGKTLLPFAKIDQSTVDYFHDAKINWKECYLKIENVDECNRQAYLNIYPQTDDYIVARLQYFKQNHLNLYLDSPKTTPGP